MRNVITMILPVDGFHFVRLKDPIQDHEKPMVMTLVKTGLVIQTINSRSIFLRNLSSQAMPLVFAVTNKDFSIRSISGDWFKGLIESKLDELRNNLLGG